MYIHWLYKILLYTQVGSDNYDCFLEIFNYLKSYYIIISEYKVEPIISEYKVEPIISEQINTKDKTKKADLDETIVKSKSAKAITKKADTASSEAKPIKIKKKPIPPIVKRNVWNKYIGEDIGKAKCTCCKLVDITQLSFHCGHIIAEAKGGELKMDNLKPICQSCNSSMGTMNMNEYIEKYGF